ncbi:LPS export ABC transporter periplasmic protein LptC [Dechloromonas sp. HYN0024]|uniref:LPS export ABC transporter periplasmic protein LptC n=1 Tax=Dechloromonas sp. HYN0024 TaxID=2231055 RepID=UPI000E43658C|nr:LPS export ABC transporter periplasmic protein LptC [Dechloromonas sp. HYN0024]AXS80770.1 LPS export ABC transporter periplasmic protein LptC [Dechloromonas sp. HYN0024]
MKHWPSHVFPVIVLAILAGLSFWLQSTVDRGETRNDGKFRHDPDAIAENFEVRRFDEQGHIRYRLTGPYLVHYPDDDTSELKTPILTSYRTDGSQINVTGEHARVTAKGETVFLWDNVVITRPATADRQAMVARMPDLTAQPEAGLAFTGSPVEINQGQSWIKGIGMDLDNNTSTLVLHAQARGVYIRPRAAP